jgi:DNA mismatch endonuclease (patch repair protein)
VALGGRGGRKCGKQAGTVDSNMAARLYFEKRTRMSRSLTLPPLPPFAPPSPARSRNMAAIKGADTVPEKAVRRALHAAGYRFRLHRRNLAGSPDIVLPRFKVAVFVHGCFWHGHDCTIGHVPRSNTEYWRAKIARNVSRDTSSCLLLEENGWQVVVVRECTLPTDIARLNDLVECNKIQCENN